MEYSGAVSKYSVPLLSEPTPNLKQPDVGFTSGDVKSIMVSN